MPYKQRDHSWNHAQHDNTNFYDFRDDATKGYHDTVSYEEPHPTNVPYLQPSDPPEKCEEDATNALKAATTSEEMKAAKEAVDKCVSALKKELDAAAEENKDTTGQTIGVAAGDGKDVAKMDKSKKTTKAKAGGKEAAKPDLTPVAKKDDSKKEDPKKDDKPIKKDDAIQKLEKQEKADDKKDKAEANKGKEQKIAKAQASAMPDVAKDAKVHRSDLTPVVKPSAVKSAHDKAAEIPKPATKEVKPTNSTVKAVAKETTKAAVKEVAKNDTKKADKGGWTEPPTNKPAKLIKDTPKNATNSTAQQNGPAPGLRTAAPIQVKPRAAPTAQAAESKNATQNATVKAVSS